ncbi:MAG: hypothetical protein ABI822_20640 [Bryobacteraceae bacterium]
MKKSAIAMMFAVFAQAQVYSPLVLKKGQPDPTNLKAMARGIIAQSGAVTPRAKAEAIWRFFLTDGRFVKPGFWYHIAGWAYEEPRGEVLDPIKLMNSYGFGLCYQIAPLLADLWEAGGVGPARVWFLTGHTVAEVFYDGAYHYFDSDMMGYNTLPDRSVASVHQLELDPGIMLGKPSVPRADPWYPADVRANAMKGLADLFTTTEDNWIFPFERSPHGHTMDFVLRPGERMIRYYQPETTESYYLPKKFDGTSWTDFPQEIAQYNIRTKDGPRSQKDQRLWATGVIEYRPPALQDVYQIPSPYVIIDAKFRADGDPVTAETSTDGGRTWTKGTSAVAGSYGYLIRFQPLGAKISSLILTTRFQLNPRTLPELTPGNNELQYSSGSEKRTVIPVRADKVEASASKTVNITYAGDAAQGYVINRSQQAGELIFELDGQPLTGFDAGGRFLDLRDGLAPDKLTAEVRKVAPWPAKDAAAPTASISWSRNLEGPYKVLWAHDPKVAPRTLRWPEVDRSVRGLPAGTGRIYVKYQIRGMAIDDFRLAAITPASSQKVLRITHRWRENGEAKEHTEDLTSPRTYSVSTAAASTITNEALIFESLPR